MHRHRLHLVDIALLIECPGEVLAGEDRAAIDDLLGVVIPSPEIERLLKKFLCFKVGGS